MKIKNLIENNKMSLNEDKRKHLGRIILIFLLIALCFKGYFIGISFLKDVIAIKLDKIYKPHSSNCESVNNIPCKINGINLHFDFDPKIFFASGCLKNHSGQQFDMNFGPRAIFHIEEFINRYNSNFIKTNLTDIFILKNLTFGEKPTGGAYCKSKIYIVYDTDYIETPVQAMMHSEFSSILMKKYSFPIQEWQLINDKNFVYTNNILEVLGKEETNTLLPDSLEAGFITEYAKTTLENDFNMIVMVLFTQEVELCELRRRYARIDKKAELAIKFYESINSGVNFLECKH